MYTNHSWVKTNILFCAVSVALGTVFFMPVRAQAMSIEDIKNMISGKLAILNTDHSKWKTPQAAAADSKKKIRPPAINDAKAAIKNTSISETKYDNRSNASNTSGRMIESHHAQSDPDRTTQTRGKAHLVIIRTPASAKQPTATIEKTQTVANSESPYISSLDPGKYVYIPKNENEYMDRILSHSITSPGGVTQNNVPGAKIVNDGREFTEAETEGIANVHNALPPHMRGLITYVADGEPGSAGAMDGKIFLNDDNDGVARTTLETQCTIAHESGHIFEDNGFDARQRADWADIWNDSVANGRKDSSYPCKYAQNNFAGNLVPKRNESGMVVYDGYGRAVYISTTDKDDDGNFKTCSGEEMLSSCNEYYMTNSHAFTQQAIETAQKTGDDTLLRSASFIATEVYGVNNKGAGALGHSEVTATDTYIFRMGADGGMESKKVGLKTVTVNGKDYQVPDYPAGW